MSKRLQVLLPDQEMSDIQQQAKNELLTVGEWVRRTLRGATERKPQENSEAKINAIRRAAEYSFPTGDIEQMLGEIDRS